MGEIPGKLHKRLGIPKRTRLPDRSLLELKTLEPGQCVKVGKIYFTAPKGEEYHKFIAEVVEAMNFRKLPNKQVKAGSGLKIEKMKNIKI